MGTPFRGRLFNASLDYYRSLSSKNTPTFSTRKTFYYAHSEQYVLCLQDRLQPVADGRVKVLLMFAAFTLCVSTVNFFRHPGRLDLLTSLFGSNDCWPIKCITSPASSSFLAIRVAQSSVPKQYSIA